MNETDPIAALADLLRHSHAQAVVSENPPAPSTVYDLSYRIMVVASAFDLHARSYNKGRRLLSPKLKLLQFIAIRPWLLPVVREWSASRKSPQHSLMKAHQLRRSFLGDAMHDRVVDLLVARRVLVRSRSHLMTGRDARVLTTLHGKAVDAGLFKAEHQVLKELLRVTITNRMLGGG